MEKEKAKPLTYEQQVARRITNNWQTPNEQIKTPIDICKEPIYV